MKYGLTDEEFKLINRLAILPIKQAKGKVWIFGSRATGRQSKYSDIDLLITLPNENNDLIGEISEKLENSNLPYKVDLVLEKDLAASYRPSVEAERVLL